MGTQQNTADGLDGQTDNNQDIESIQESVKLRNLRKEFDDVVAVNNIDLEVSAGEFVVLLGPSGCGKTTTLRMIAGLETPTSGTIVIGGQDVTTVPPQDRNLSMVFQSYALYPHLTIRENLEYPLRKMALSVDERSRKVNSVAEMLGIREHLDKKPDQLSGGQQQRVAIGRTIVREPRVFLMDEPLSNLDAKLRVETRAELQELQQDLGVTTVYVTHDQEEAMSIADRLVIMNEGRIEQTGTPKEIYEKPANTFVSGFVGEPAINLIDISKGWSRRLGGDVPSQAETIGIRPENLYVEGNVDSDVRESVDLSEPVSLTLDLIEPLGDTYELTLTDESDTLITVLSRAGRTLTEGTDVEVVADMSKVHLFDSEGEAIR
ncbi:ABC transporter ATP-binding protein [Halopelagius fulvigenes]|uniref:ABC-type D-xylose/L-arabinose transporter n=1 Tax=Halopelagius fulvigenes TaxID=1198324 RepID=A0ABD5TY24_9EURY